MKIKSFSFLVITIYCLSLVSCTKILHDFEFEDKDPRIAVQARFEADSTVHVLVTRSLDMFDRRGLVTISEASVSLYPENDDQGILFHSDSSGWYSLSPGSITEGVNYELRIEAGEYPPVSASFTVPEFPDIISIDTSHSYSTVSYGSVSMQIINFTFQFKDNPLTEDYYILSARSLNEQYTWDDFGNILDTIFVYSGVDLNSKSPYIEVARQQYWGYTTNNQNLTWYGQELYFSDRHFNGNDDVSIEVSYAASDDFYYYNNSSDDRQLDLYFASVDKNFYQYMLAKAEELASANNPLSEPVTPYSNVEEGFGLVYGKSVRKFQYQIKMDEVPAIK